MPLVLWADVLLDQRGEPWMTRRRHPRLWFTADRSRLVTDGDPEADTLAFGEHEDPVDAGRRMMAAEAARRRVLFFAWLDANQPHEPAGCPAAVRDPNGLYRPCRSVGVPTGVLCAAHDPVTREANAALRRYRVEAFWRGNYQWCNWVAEGVPA